MVFPKPATNTARLQASLFQVVIAQLHLGVFRDFLHQRPYPFRLLSHIVHRTAALAGPITMLKRIQCRFRELHIFSPGSFSVTGQSAENSRCLDADHAAAFEFTAFQEKSFIKIFVFRIVMCNHRLSLPIIVTFTLIPFLCSCNRKMLIQFACG